MDRQSIVKWIIFVSIAVSVPFVSAVAALAREATTFQFIERVNVDGSRPIYYFYNGTSRWGAPSCPEAFYVYFDDHSVPGAKPMLSVALLAKSTGKKVVFLGDCVGSSYFKADYIIME